MNFYIRFPTDENISEFENRCAEFKANLIIEKIKRLKNIARRKNLSWISIFSIE